MEQEFDVLGFNPADLSVFNQQESVSGPNNIYHPMPKDSKSKDGVYRSTIKLIYNPFNVNDSIVETQTYNMTDSNGFFNVVSSLTNNDKNCPIFKAWSKYRFSSDPKEQLIAASEAKGGPGYFDKRYTRWTTIQVMEDKNNPDLVGKFLLWKMPKAIYDMVTSRMKPSADSGKAAIPVMDFLFGRPIELEVTPGPDDPLHPERKTREISYASTTISDDTMCVTEPDGSSILSDEEQVVLNTYVSAMKPVWKSKDADERNKMIAEINADPNTAKLRTIYRNVLTKLKEYCPNIREEVGYKPWSDETSARVKAYLDCIAAGKNPKQGMNDAISAFENDTQVVPTQPVAPEFQQAFIASEPTEDLPF